MRRQAAGPGSKLKAAIGASTGGRCRCRFGRCRGWLAPRWAGDGRAARGRVGVIRPSPDSGHGAGASGHRAARPAGGDADRAGWVGGAARDSEGPHAGLARCGRARRRLGCERAGASEGRGGREGEGQRRTSRLTGMATHGRSAAEIATPVAPRGRSCLAMTGFAVATFPATGVSGGRAGWTVRRYGSSFGAATMRGSFSSSAARENSAMSALMSAWYPATAASSLALSPR